MAKAKAKNALRIGINAGQERDQCTIDDAAAKAVSDVSLTIDQHRIRDKADILRCIDRLRLRVETMDLPTIGKNQ